MLSFYEFFDQVYPMKIWLNRLVYATFVQVLLKLSFKKG